MYHSDRIVVVIPAAGAGKRMGVNAPPKQLLPLRGVPVLIHTLRRFEICSCVDDIVVVCAPETIEETKTLVQRYACHKVNRFAIGGRERQDSVYAGVCEAGDAGIILVHDAARPFVREDRIDELVSISHQMGAAVLGVPVKDTIKEVSDKREVVRTLDRKTLWHIQTPQAFKAQVLRKAYDMARTDGFVGTDESMLVERLGIEVRIVEGHADNIKITNPEDWPIAEAILGSHPEWNSI